MLQPVAAPVGDVEGGLARMYAKVSSDRQGVDLSVTAQLKTLKDLTPMPTATL